jgi:uncharacterized lipoprotein YddW (UPF0748 family)
MPIFPEYTAPTAAAKPADAPCCSSCASPDERAEMLRTGAARVGAAINAHRRRRQQLGDATADLDLQEANTYFWTPDAVHSYVEKANTEIWALANDYSQAISRGAISQPQLQAFKAFFNEWQTWYDDQGFFAYLSGSTAATAAGFRQRAKAWRTPLQNAGVQPSTPEAAVQVGTAGAQPSQYASAIKWAAGAAIAVAGAVVIGQAAKAAGVLRRA